MNTLLKKPAGFTIETYPNDWFTGASIYSGRNEVKRTLTVPTNIEETDRDYRITLLAPGFSKNDFSIKVSGNTLQITADPSTIENDQIQSLFKRKDFEIKGFSQSFTVPVDKVTIDSIEAAYENGILDLKIPKKEEQKPREHQVVIK